MQASRKINSASLDIDSEDISEAIKMQVSQSGGTNKICNSVGATACRAGFLLETLRD